MPKFKLFALIISIFFQFFVIPTNAFAANCTFTYSPTQPNQNMEDLSMTIKSDEIKDGTYRIQLIRANNSTDYIRDISFTSGTTLPITTKKPPGTKWLPGTYKIYFIEQDTSGQPQDIFSCQTSFTITDIPVSGSCTASIKDRPIDPDTRVTLVLSGLQTGTYNILINGVHKFTNSIISAPSMDGAAISSSELNLGNYNVGAYSVSVKKDSRLQCKIVNFEVAKRGSGGGGEIITPDNSGPAPVAPPCTGPSCTTGGGIPCDASGTRGPGIKTAIGCIHTNPSEFVADFMTFTIGISGGLAFLMMLLGAFQMLTSAGNPDSLNNGRSRLTSAIIGLLFVIFATLLMQVIGVDILFRGFEGFNR